MHYRNAVPDDAPLIARINRQLIEDEWGGGGMALEGLERRARSWIEDGDYRALLFEEDDALVAYALLSIDDDSAYVRHFFVMPEHRRGGVGRRALDLVLQEVVPPSVRITLDVLASNRSGHEFWRSVGFRDYSIRMERLPHTEGAPDQPTG